MSSSGFRGSQQAYNQFRQMLMAQTRGGGGGGGGSRFPGGPGRLLAGGGGLVALVVAGVAVNASLFNVDGGHRAIKYTRLHGVSRDIYAEGTHFMIPWFETVIDYDVRAKPLNIASLTGTKDLQMVNITCRVLSRPKVDELPTIYRTLGQDYDAIVIPSIVHEALKSVIAQFTASQLITQRERISRLVRENMLARANKFNITLDDVSLTHVQFSPDFAAAVEQKQIAQQEVHRAAFIVDSARQEKQAKIVASEGEARAASLIGRAVGQNPSYIELKRVETAREIAHILADGKNKMLLDSQSLLLNVANPDRDTKARK